MSRRKIEKRIPPNAKGLANALNILNVLNKTHKIRLEPEALVKTFHFAQHHVALGAAIANHPAMKPLALAAIDAVETSDQKPVADVLLNSVTITTYSKEG